MSHFQLIVMSGPVPLKGVPGILRPFKEYLEDPRLRQKVPGSIRWSTGYLYPVYSTPFAFAVRGLRLEQVFVPYFTEEKARKIEFEEEVGMQASLDTADTSSRSAHHYGRPCHARHSGYNQ